MACPSESLTKMMGYVDIPLDEKQLELQRHVNISKVRGDPKLIESPSNVDAAREVARNAEFEQNEHQISGSVYYQIICLLRDYVVKLTGLGPVRYHDFQQQIGIVHTRYMPIF